MDQTFADGFLRDVPIIGTAYKMAMLGKSVSDHIFITKLARFLKALEDVPEHELASFRHEFDNGEISARKVGEALVLAIDRVDDSDKLPLLARIFRAYVGKTISYVEFRQIYVAVDSSTISDIVAFCESDSKDVSLRTRLLTSGLTAMGTSGLSSQGGPVFLTIAETDVGKTLRRVMRGDDAPQ